MASLKDTAYVLRKAVKEGSSEGSREGIRKGVEDIRRQDLHDANMREIKQSMKMSPLEFLLSAGAVLVFMTAFLIVGTVAALLSATLYIWQFSFMQLSDLYAASGVSFGLIINIAALVLIACCWAFCIFKVVKSDQKKSKLFIILFGVFSVLCYALPRTLFVGPINGILSYLIYGLLIAVLPTFVLIDIAYVLSHGYGLLRKMAYQICRGKGLRLVIFAILAVLAIFLGVLFLILLAEGEYKAMVIEMGVSLLMTGALFIYFSIFGKKAPVAKNLRKQEENYISNNAGEKEWYTMTAEYNGTTYMCSFDEDGQYQDVSSNEQFYYHGGVIPELGDKSGFYFLVWVTFDDLLAAVIPMYGVTPENYDEKFDAMIREFESSQQFQDLSEYHLDRCAQIVMESEDWEDDE